MKMCGDHWNALREEVKKQGLWEFVSASGEHLAGKLLDGADKATESKETFDPLMRANMAIIFAVVERAGLGVLATDNCPLCMVKEKSVEKDFVTNWIEGAVGDELKLAIEQGWIKKQ